MKTIIFISMSLMSFLNANASDYTKDLSLPKDADISILSIDTKHQMIEVSSVKFPGEDASWLKIADFGSSVDVEKGQEVRFLAELGKGNEKLIGRKFKLKKEITTYVHKSAFKSSKAP